MQKIPTMFWKKMKIDANKYYRINYRILTSKDLKILSKTSQIRIISSTNF